MSDDLRATVATSASVDVRPQVQEAIGDVVVALEKQLDAVREAIPTAHIARVASEVQQLRTLLVGPN